MEYVPKTYSSAGVVIGQDNELILVQEFGYFWGLPRGHIESEESPKEAAIREIAEESGIADLTEVAELGSYVRSTYDKEGNPNYNEIKHITGYAFRTSQQELAPKDSDITDAGWFSPEQAVSKLINREDIAFLEAAITKLRSLGHLN